MILNFILFLEENGISLTEYPQMGPYSGAIHFAYVIQRGYQVYLFQFLISILTLQILKIVKLKVRYETLHCPLAAVPSLPGQKFHLITVI